MAHRYLFEQMVRRELRQKYKGSALGVLWYLINPLVLMGAYYLMFGVLFKVAGDDQPEHYPLFLLVGLVVWIFFSQAVMSSAPSLLEHGALVRKARFPREAIPASVVTVQLVTFVALLALLTPIIVAIRGTGPALFALPLVLALLFAFVLGVALAVSVLHAYFRDVAPILSAALLPWFFLSPIFFDPVTADRFSDHPDLVFVLEWLNPVAPFIVAVRDVVYDGAFPGLDVLAYIAVAAGLVLAGGLALFRRMQGELAVVV